MRFLLVLVVLTTLVVPTLAGYEWRTFPDDKDEIALWKDGSQVGNYRHSEGKYYPLLGKGKWGDPCELPCPLPDYFRIVPSVQESNGILNFGIDTQKVKKAPPHVLNGRPVSRAQLLEAIEGSTLPDDAHLPFLTIIGPESDRQRVLSDLESSPLLSAWKGRFRIQGYEPSHWAVAQSGFVTTGKPTIYCQAPDGTVLHRQDVYRGPKALAEVLRKADPAYQPDRDPDLNKPLSSVPLGIWIGGGILLVLLWKGEEK